MDEQVSKKTIRLTRSEAATYITDNYFPFSKASLDKHASNGTGPVYAVIGPNSGGATFYKSADLDAWCERQFKAPAARKKKDWVERKLAKVG
jgi:hypothetical protein